MKYTSEVLGHFRDCRYLGKEPDRSLCESESAAEFFDVVEKMYRQQDDKVNQYRFMLTDPYSLPSAIADAGIIIRSVLARIDSRGDSKAPTGEHYLHEHFAAIRDEMLTYMTHPEPKYRIHGERMTKMIKRFVDNIKEINPPT